MFYDNNNPNNAGSPPAMTIKTLSLSDSVLDKVEVMKHFAANPPVLSVPIEGADGAKLFVASGEAATALKEVVSTSYMKNPLGESDSVADKLVLMRQLGIPMFVFDAKGVSFVVAEKEQAQGLQDGLPPPSLQ